MYLYSKPEQELLIVHSNEPIAEYQILDAEGNLQDCPVLDRKLVDGQVVTRFDGTALQPWSPDSPVLYTFCCGEERIRFGHVSMSVHQNKEILLNGTPIYLRGYIRGIVAHDHPNMTGGSAYDAAVKNIRQAKKYGFNLVRFHSTIPSEEFVRAADELGMLIHMEIGFSYEYDTKGNKSALSMSNELWEQTILRYRNHPSVAVFCIGNELHKSGHFPQVHKLYEQGKRLAPSKFIMDNSGWGEYDRSTADIFSQHVAYFFPYKHHGEMFLKDDQWFMNGSVSDQAMDVETARCKVTRRAVPVRPVLSHEAMHYIDIPDYEAMNAKFDAFAERVGPAYLEANGIDKPRYLKELPRLIRAKGLQDRMQDYMEGSRQFRLMATKVFLERLRMSGHCGYEMLQLSDCLKYENKNGILDCFDDDKGIDPNWMRQFNSDLVLLAQIHNETVYNDQPLAVTIYASDFLPQPMVSGKLSIWMDEDCLYEGENFTLAGGLQKLVDLEYRPEFTAETACRSLRVTFTTEDLTVTNSWKLWFFPRVHPQHTPELALEDRALEAYLAGGTPVDGTLLTDTFNENVLAHLEQGKRVILLYQHTAHRNTWQMPGALERFKPCIWDRGSNLGGMICNDGLQRILGAGRYFDLNMQPLLEAGTKVNLDSFPGRVNEIISGIDKPVRDRMKGLIHGVKDFIQDDTLRRFSHLFSLKVGAGELIVCTLNLRDLKSPVVTNFLKYLIDETDDFTPAESISQEEFRAWLQQVKEKGLRPEDVMNHFWERDDKLVEDTLFWEEAGIDLTKLS